MPPETMTELQAGYMSSLAGRYGELLPSNFYPMGNGERRTSRDEASRWIDAVLERHPTARRHHGAVMAVAEGSASGPSGNL